MERSHRIDIARIVASEQRVMRTTSHDGGWCYLNMQVRGVGETVQSGTAVVTEPGDAVILRTDEPFTFRFDDEFSQVAVRLPEALSGVGERPIRLAAAAPDSRMIRSLIEFGTDRSMVNATAPRVGSRRGAPCTRRSKVAPALLRAKFVLGASLERTGCWATTPMTGFGFATSRQTVGSAALRTFTGCFGKRSANRRHRRGLAPTLIPMMGIL